MSSQKVFFIHGWSVRTTQTYQALHLKLAEYGFELQNIFLGRYVSLEDKVEISDLSKAMHKAIGIELNGNWDQPFHIITHSTGGMITKHWMINLYQGEFSASKGLQNIVHLAAPHFGSRLAHHGNSMLGQIMELGQAGKKILEALELGSELSWELNEKLFDDSNWKDKGIRIFNLIGDRVKRDLFKYRIFPAAYEEGSDMVVRVASGNLNFQRFELDGRNKSFSSIGEVTGIPFGALYEYTHSNDDYGILNNIKKRSTPAKQLNLKLILDCLKINDETGYDKMRETLRKITLETRTKRQGFAQLDFSFHDDQGNPINDYVFKLGATVNGKEVASKTVVHTHKNKCHSNHFTVFINLKQLEPQYSYFMDLNSDSGSKLFNYQPDPLRETAQPNDITNIIKEDQTTQINVILSRIPSDNLFVFHRGDDQNLHVKWGRDGKVKSNKLGIK